MDQSKQQDLVFLFDVDNTLLDNDRIVDDLRAYIAQMLGAEQATRYWEIHNALRQRIGYVDYLAALQAYRLQHLDEVHWQLISTFLLEYPFAQCLFTGVDAVLQHCRRWGTTVILSDGDAVFQPYKIHRSGLRAAVEERVLIYVHKETKLEEVQRRYPASHYVMVDDKLTILTAMKKQLGARLTTVFPQQGHYALDADILQTNPAADITIERIGDLLQYDKAALLQAALPRK